MGRPGFKSPKNQYDDFRKKTYIPPPPRDPQKSSFFDDFFARGASQKGGPFFAPASFLPKFWPLRPKSSTISRPKKGGVHSPKIHYFWPKILPKMVIFDHFWPFLTPPPQTPKNAQKCQKMPKIAKNGHFLPFWLCLT